MYVYTKLEPFFFFLISCILSIKGINNLGFLCQMFTIYDNYEILGQLAQL